MKKTFYDFTKETPSPIRKENSLSIRTCKHGTVLHEQIYNDFYNVGFLMEANEWKIFDINGRMSVKGWALPEMAKMNCYFPQAWKN